MGADRQLKTARMTGTTVVDSTPGQISDLENALSIITGITKNVDVNTSPFTINNSTGAVTIEVSLQIISGPIITAIKDEDNMASDSATALATQQSIKAYVDSSSGGTPDALRVVRSSSQSIPNDSITPVNFDLTLFNTTSWTIGSSPWSVTVPTGIYQINGNAVWPGNNFGSNRWAYINGLPNSYQASAYNTPGSWEKTGHVGTIDRVSSGTRTYNFYVYQDSGSSIALVADFSIVRLGDA